MNRAAHQSVPWEVGLVVVVGSQEIASSMALGRSADSRGPQNSCQSGLSVVGASAMAMSWRSSSMAASRRLQEPGVRVVGKMVEVMVSRVVGEDCHLLASPAAPHHRHGCPVTGGVHDRR